MKKYIYLFILTLGIILKGNSQSEALNAIANQYLQDYKIPGITISVIQKDTILYGVAGVKKNGANEKIGLDSKFQIASNSKAITAMIAAKAVEEGSIKWDSKIIEVIPKLKGKIKADYYDVSLEALLSNRGKVQAFEEDNSKEWNGLPKTIAGSSDSKLEFAQYALNLEPKVSSENNHSYSNGGFIIAALMLEQATKTLWTDLIAQFNQHYDVDIFPGFPSQEVSTQTHGHKKKGGKYKAVAPEDEYGFNFDFSPAGNLSINIMDLTKVMAQHLNGLLGEDNILKSSTYKKLHYGLDDYALGWYNGNIGDTEQKFSYHGGSLGTFSSAIMVSADREIVIIILVNADNKKINELKNSLRVALWEKYGSLQNNH